MSCAPARYRARQIRWGARHADLLSEPADGGLRLDMRRFDAPAPTAPIEGFPYSDAGAV